MNTKKSLTILICAGYVYGSINPCKGIAEILKRGGYKIIFYANGMIKEFGNDAIEIINDDTLQQRLKDVTDDLVRIGIFESSLKPIEKLKLITLAQSYTIKQSKSLDANVNEIINSINPDVIIVDLILKLPSVFKSGRPWVAFANCNPLRFIEDDLTPPPLSGLPSNDRSQWDQFRKEYYRLYEPYTRELNDWLIKEELTPMKKNQIIYLSNHLNIYNYPKELDYTDMRPLPSKFVQFDAFVRIENDDFEIPKNLKDKSGKLILLSMGTLTSANVHMMKRLIEILSQTQHRYIVSKGLNSDRYELPDNMWGEPMLPQTKVLPLVDMLITHGGQNGIVEAFYYGKPMIVMPICNDGYDNAQRVMEKGFGVRMDPFTCTRNELINAIDCIVNDKQLINRMKEISLRIQNEAKSDELTRLIEDLTEHNAN